jgi:phosphatidylinositol-3-phosphatase
MRSILSASTGPSHLLRRLGLMVAPAVLVAACHSSAVAPPATGPARSGPVPGSAIPTTQPPASGTHKILVVLFENHSMAEALQQMPHLRQLARRYGQATDYFAVAHPSLPNYLAIWGGSTFGVQSDCSVGDSGCVPAPPSVFGQALSHGRTVRVYAESMPGNCATADSGDYAPRHGPWPYWTTPAERSGCVQNQVPSGTTQSGRLSDDVAAGSLPDVGELVPNLCNDAHDCDLATADKWLWGWARQLIAGPDFRAGRLTVVITFDEDDSSAGNKVAFVVMDPRLHGKVVAGKFSHYSLTRWIDSVAGLPLLRNAAHAGDLRRAFGL